MKLLVSNGRRLTAHDVGPVIMELAAATVPIKLNGKLIVDDAAARSHLRELLDTNLYRRTI